MTLREQVLVWWDAHPEASASEVSAHFEGQASPGTCRVWRGRFRPDATPTPKPEPKPVLRTVAPKVGDKAQEEEREAVRIVAPKEPRSPRTRATPPLPTPRDDVARPRPAPRNTPPKVAAPPPEPAAPRAEAPRWAPPALPVILRPPPQPIPHEALTAGQQAALGYLLDARPTVDVLAAAECSRTELRAWQRDPVFAGVLSDLRAERRKVTMEQLDAGSDEAVSTLRAAIRGEALPSGAKPDKVAVTAAIALLDRTIPKTERIEHTGGGGVLRVEGLKELSREQLEALAAGEDEDEAANG